MYDKLVDKPRLVPVEFNGKGLEYFKIWIVNIALTIITLGIYSAWAKVRTQQYFYGNTKVASHSFEYLATGKQILIGRIIAVVIFILFQALPAISLYAALVFIAAFVLAAPWLMNSGLRFNAKMSAWRNVRFNFAGNYFGAVMAFFVWPILGLITLGLLMPKSVHKSAQYIVTNHSYGKKSFEFTASVSNYVSAIYGLIILYLIAGIGLALSISMQIFWLTAVAILAFYAIGFSIKPILFNLYWKNTQLKGNGFNANMKAGRFAWIFISNSIAVGFSLGLLYPWSKVRLAKYTADCLQLIDVGNLDSFAAAQQSTSNAMGEELGEIFDVDVGFGV